MEKNLDLGTLFKAVTQQLAENKDTLNEADSYNHNHGDNMVEIFSLVQQAVSQKAEQPISDQLDYASKVVEKEVHSGSASLYAEGLSKAAKNLVNTDLNEKSIGTLVQSLLGADKPAPVQQPQNQGDMLGSLLSSFTGGGSTNQQSQGDVLGSLLSGFTGGGSTSQQNQGDVLGSLLSSFTGGEETSQQDQGLGLDSLLQAGMAYFASKQDGDSNIQAIIEAIMAASPMGKSAHRTQSGSLVASTIMNLAKNFLQ